MSGAATSIHSDLWHRVHGLRPRLKPETVVSRQVIRGEVWYVASDRFLTRSCRFTPAVWSVLMRLDGRRTMHRVWREVVDEFGADAPAQDQILSVVSQLYAAELVSSDTGIDEGELAERAQRQTRQLAASRYRNPMFIRWRLVDPDRALAATLHLVRPFCGPLGFTLWLAAMVWFVAEAALHWGELSGSVSDRVLASGNILVFLLVFPPLKVLHELGHAYAVKLGGGAVHEIGISFLTFMPAPYVDASASVMFPSRWHRAAVGAAGMIVELAAAAAAMAVWLNSEPGLVRSVAYDVVFIASVSTVVFNINPLLRFDGYYILSDLLELPNLAARSSRLYLAGVQRKLFGLGHVPIPTTAPRERFWLLAYAPAALVYRVFVVIGIAFFVGTQYFFFGVALVAWMLATTFAWPLLKGLSYVLMSPALTGRRGRAVALTGGAVLALVGAVAYLPVPHATVVEGVVWVPEDTRVVPEVSGHVAEILAKSGSRVTTGMPLLRLEDPFLASRRAGAEARMAELQARLTAAETASPYETQLIRNQLAFARNDLDETLRKQRALLVRSPAAGIVVLPKAHDLDGSYARQGALLGYVMSGAAPLVRALVPEGEIDLVRSEIRGVAVRLGSDILSLVSEARIAREYPGATRQIQSQALAAPNGGPFQLDPSDKDGNTMLFPAFAVDVEVASDHLRDHWGERAWVRFDHGASPMLRRWWRAARQVFLGHFHV